MKYLAISALLAASGVGVFAQDAPTPKASGPPKGGAPGSGAPGGGGKATGGGKSAGGGKAAGGGKGGGGMGGTMGTLSQLGPSLNTIIGKPASPPSGCAKLEVLVARGTYEPGPFGFIVGDPLIPMVKAKVQGARGYNVQYPADASVQSMPTGVSDTVKRLNQQSKDCPTAKFAIVGYSQGAAVMHQAAAKLDASIQQKIVAVVMYGDPGRRMSKFPAKLQARVFQNCAKGDFCGDGTQGNGHLSYRDGTFHKDSAAFIAAGFNGTPQQARP